jgi:K+-transporting ATPase ATPase C chain
MNSSQAMRPGELPTVSSSPTSRGAAAGIGGRQLLIAVRFLLAMTVVLGVLYPLVTFGIGRLFPDRADGSLIRDQAGTVVGSEIIGQQFDGPTWFHGRPSAAGDGYDAMSSGGSNLAADSPELLQQVTERRAAVAAENGVPESAVPADALTASASGLDPHISPAYARLQVNRVAEARGLSPTMVADLVESQIQGRTLGFIGEERVNVLQLNLALERLTPTGSGG